MAIINGTSLNDTLIGTLENDLLNGLTGSDILSGLAGNDRLIGHYENETNTTDTIVSYSTDPKNLNSGSYAIITDFNKNEDTIQLAITDFGASVSYFLGFSPSGLPIGRALYCNTISYFIDANNNIVVDVGPLQLVAVLPGVSDLSLNDSCFTFI